MVGDKGVDAVALPAASAAARALRDDDVLRAFVNSGSKLEVSACDESFGLKGGTRFYGRVSLGVSLCGLGVDYLLRESNPINIMEEWVLNQLLRIVSRS